MQWYTIDNYKRGKYVFEGRVISNNSIGEKIFIYKLTHFGVKVVFGTRKHTVELIE
jgi:hypothetical protein